MEKVTYRGVDIQIRQEERPYFEAAASGRLTLQCCASCHAVQYPPGRFCGSCASEDLTWRDSTGEGRLVVSLLVEHGVRGQFPPPYAYGLVELDDIDQDGAQAVRILTDLVDQDGAPVDRLVAEGTKVEVTFEPLTPGLALPRFRVRG